MGKAQNKRAAKIAAEWWASRLQSGNKLAFQQHLEQAIQSELNANGRCYTECDYDPRGILLDAVRAAGIKCQGMMFSADGILPRKHELDIEPDCLTPKEGYGNRTKEIKVPRR